jgi:radical SAM superfamily enzyme YgiQ (UPF0313 family)
MRALLVQAATPITYWGYQHSLPFVRKGATLPPLGLATLAALLPDPWQLRIRDLHLAPLDDADLDWADAVLVSGMLAQASSMHEVLGRARARGKVTVVGGPAPTTSPDAFPEASYVFRGEAEGRLTRLVEALERPGGVADRVVSPPGMDRPDMALSRVPRFDLLELDRYATQAIQVSRGCPFTCEFCDIIEVFGRLPRTKPPEQLCRDLDAIYATGFRGSVFLADDNLVGNKNEAIRLFKKVREWMVAHKFPFMFYGEASINLANCEDLMDAMVNAGFDSVFVGIETPSEDALRETRKAQNLAVDIHASVQKLVRHGLDISAGFIVGFDSDDAASIERLRRWVAESIIPESMVGILTALPGTQLERRLIREDRLVNRASGETFGRANFRTKMDEVELLEAYRRLMADIYRPEAYFERVNRMLEMRPISKGVFSLPWTHAAACVARSVLVQGILGKYKLSYWRFLARVLLKTPRRLPRAFSLAIAGEHMIRYTADDVIPRLGMAIDQVKAENGKDQVAA